MQKTIKQEIGWVAVVLTITLLVFFRAQFLSGFENSAADRTDTIIQASLLEHWYNVFRGLSSWNRPGYFYPHTGTLGYNDGYFLYGIWHSGFRLAGADVLLSTELVNIALKAIGFIGMHCLAYRAVGVPLLWSLFAASLFTMAGSTYLRGSHAQLYAVAFAPLFWFFLWRFIEGLIANRRFQTLVWGILASTLMSTWLLSAYYMAWFTLIFTFLAVFFLAILNLPFTIRTVRGLGLHQTALLCIIALTFVLEVMPFLLVYLPKAKETGMHSLYWSLYLAPRWYDVANVSPLNLMFGSAFNSFIPSVCDKCEIDQVERMTGFTPIVLALFLIGIILATFTDRFRTVAIIRPALLAVALSWACVLRIGDVSLWTYVFEFLPGAAAIRVPARFQIFLTAPMSLIVTIVLWKGIETRLIGYAAIPIILAGEMMSPRNGPSRTAQLARLSMPTPPSTCKSFFVGPAIDQAVETLFAHNVDAMMIAALRGIPTINGISSFNPPDWVFSNPSAPDYDARVASYVANHQLENVCKLDLVNKTWTRFNSGLN